jgi:hypothetical protein
MFSPVFPKCNGTLAQADLACGYTAPLALDHHGAHRDPPSRRRHGGHLDRHGAPRSPSSAVAVFLQNLFAGLLEMGFTRTLVILLIGVVVPLVVVVTVLIGHTRSTPMSPLQVTRDAIDGARL